MTAALLEQPLEDTAHGFAALRSELRDRGLLEPRRGWYARSIASTGAGWVVLCVVMALLGSSWWQLLCAVAAAVLSARMAFFGHDAGHDQIARTRRANRLLGLVHGNLLIGLSYRWWVGKHNRHHAHPNDTERDPDVGLGAIAWTPDQVAGRAGPAGRWLARHQSGLFIPLLLLEAVHLKISSIQAMRAGARRGRAAERLALVAHYGCYLLLLLLVMSPWQALVFALIHQALFGLLLGSAFAPNHKGMPMPPAGAAWSHFRQQVVTSRNVMGGRLTDWLLGGLNYQIEHHLFPRMPRPNLRRAAPVVRRHCDEAGLAYTAMPAMRSYRLALGHLAAVARTGSSSI